VQKINYFGENVKNGIIAKCKLVMGDDGGGVHVNLFVDGGGRVGRRRIFSGCWWYTKISY
jgi:hypothetical protein